MLRYVYDSITDTYELTSLAAQRFATAHNIPIAGKGDEGWYIISAACEGRCDITIEDRHQPY